MKKQAKKALLLSLVAIAPVIGTGCAAVAVGAAAGGTMAYVRGDLEVTYESSLEQVRAAALAAIDDLGFVTVSDRADRTSGEIVARTARDRRIQITMTPVTADATEVSIRVGAFGDQDLSMRLHEAIREQL